MLFCILPLQSLPHTPTPLFLTSLAFSCTTTHNFHAFHQNESNPLPTASAFHALLVVHQAASLLREGVAAALSASSTNKRPRAVDVVGSAGIIWGVNLLPYLTLVKRNGDEFGDLCGRAAGAVGSRARGLLLIDVMVCDKTELLMMFFVVVSVREVPDRRRVHLCHWLIWCQR